MLIIGIYGLGIFVPLLTSPREEQMAAEDRAATAEAERDAAIEQAERERLAAELERIEASQSQFELYTDRGGKHRWRLRHRNGRILADSGQGYASRSGAEAGINSVKRNAPNADVITDE